MHRTYQPEPDHHHPRRPLRLAPLLPWLLLAYLATGLYSVKTDGNGRRPAMRQGPAIKSSRRDSISDCRGLSIASTRCKCKS